MFLGEERRIIILGLDFSSIPLIKHLCENNIRNILVAEDSIEPGYYTGTYRSAGFVIEKLYSFLDPGDKKIFDKLGAETLCARPRVRVAKPGDLIYKIACWKKDLAPWWISGDFSETCLVRNSGDFLREKILGGCAEYTFYTPRKIDLDKKIMVLRNGRVVKYEKLVVSYPVNRFLEASYSKDLPREYLENISNMKWIGLLSISYGVRGEKPEWDIVLHATRASRTHIFSVVSNMIPGTAPEGHYLINLQMSYCHDNHPPPDALSRGIAEARWAKLISDESNIVLERIFVLHHMIPYNTDLEKLDEIKKILSEKYEIFLLGVRGEGISMNMRDQMSRAEAVVEKIL